MTVLPLIVPLFCMVMIAAYYAVLFKRKLNETYFLSSATIIFILYIFGLLNFQGSLLAGYALILVMALLSLAFLIKTYLKDRAVVDSTSYKSGLLLLLIFLGVSLLINYGRVFTTWDEFSHWGTVVKHMYHFDALGTYRGANLSYSSYVPGTALFQYFWVRPFFQFTEYAAYLAFNMLIVSLALTFVSRSSSDIVQDNYKSKKGRKKKKKQVEPDQRQFSLKNIILAFFFLLIPLAMQSSIYNTLYVDSFLGVIFGSVFLLYFYYRYEQSYFGILMVTSAVGLLTLTKHVGLILSAIAIGVIVFDLVFFRRNTIRKYLQDSSGSAERIRRALLLGSPVLAVIFIQLSWRVLLSVVDISERWSVTGGDLMQFIRGDLLPYQQNVLDNFMTALSRVPLFPFGFAYVHIVVVSLVFALILGVWLTTHKVNMSRPFVLYLLVILSSLAYAFFLLVAYSYTFSEYEAVRLASYDRYTLSHLIGLVLALLIFIIELPSKAIWNENSGNNMPVVITAALMLVLTYGVVSNAAEDHLYVEETVEGREPFNQVLEWDDFIAENSDQRIGIIAQGSMGHERNVLNFMIYPHRFSTGWDYSFALEPYYPQHDDPWTFIIEPEDWGPYILDNYDLLYLFRIDQLFLETYGYYFDQLIPGMIYEVTADSEGRLLLLAVGE